MFYDAEIRDFDQSRKAERERLTPEEFELATELMEKLSNPDFEPEAYGDLYRTQVLAMIDEKVKGREITLPPPAPTKRGQVIDIYAALKKSLDTAPPRAQAERGKRKKAGA